MRLIAFILTTLSLVLGAVAASTAYLPKTSVADELLLGLTLTSPAGVDPATKDAPDPMPLIASRTIITPEVLAQLREAGVERVRVKEFPSQLGAIVARWTEWWWFVAALAGFAGSAMLSRMARASRLRRAEEGRAGGATAQDIVLSIRAVVSGLVAEAPGMVTREERLEAIIQRVGALQQEDIPALLERKEVLIGRMGLGGYAGLMDAFSAAERSLNRAWSAAADGEEHEAMACLAESLARLDEVERLVPASAARPDPSAPPLPGQRTLDLPDVSFGRVTPGMPEKGGEDTNGPGRGDIPLA